MAGSPSRPKSPPSPPSPPSRKRRPSRKRARPAAPPEGGVSFDAANHLRIVALPAWRRWARGLKAFAVVARDPNRTDKVLEAYEHINAGSLRRRAARFYAVAGAERLFLEDRTLDARSVDFAALARLPEGTLGGAYARFMRTRGLTPDLFATRGALSRETYVIKRLRQTHDLWHVVTGIDTDVPGELELQAFTFGQIRPPSAVILVAFGTLRWGWRHPTLPFRVMRGWLAGMRARPLAPVDWEARWATPLVELRRALRC